jgi:hypothetical protein
VTETGAGALLRWQFRLAHRLLDRAALGLPPEAARSEGARLAAASFAQAVATEDLTVNGILAAGEPLALSTWAGRTGLSEPAPLADPAGWAPWAGRVRVDLGGARPYARAVYAATDSFLAGIPEAALDVGRGERPACLLSALLLTLAVRRGQIGCLLGRAG